MDSRSFVTAAPAAAGLRRIADQAFRALAVLFALAILLQVAFAGGGAFGAMS